MSTVRERFGDKGHERYNRRPLGIRGKILLRAAVLLVFLMSLGAVGCQGRGSGQPPEWIIMGTSTLPAETGLLGRLLPTFEKEYGVRVKVLDVGARATIRLAQRGEIDVALIDFDYATVLVNSGDGVDPSEFMYTHYLLVGPPEDPAGILGSRSVVTALRSIADGHYRFYARADGSDTQDVEEEAWRLAGIQPGDEWYVRLNKGGEEVLRLASDSHAYTITDMATYNRLKDKVKLAVAVSNAKPLVRSFVMIPVNPGRHQGVKYDWALRLSAYMASVPAQMVINDYLVADTGARSFFAFSSEWKRYVDSLKLTPQAGGQ